MAISATSNNPTLATPGLGSGLDINGLVSKLMAVEQQPLTLLNQQESSYQSQLSAYGSLKGVLSSLQTAAQALETPANFSLSTASVADTTVLTAASSTSAVAGSYNVTVTQLAQAQKQATGQGLGYANTTDVVGTGTLTISYAGGSKLPVPITIDSAHQTLSGIRDAINAANAGVTASIINDGSTNGNRLVLSANASGAANGFTLSSSDPGLSTLAGNMAQTVAAQDAKLTVDGVSVQKSSNTVTDAIQGVTLNLAKLGSSQVNVVTDTATITKNVQSFVTAYNNVVSLVKNATAYNATTQSGAVLAGDSTIRHIQQSLRGIFTSAVSGAPGGQSLLTDFGLSFQKDGTLTVDSTKLSTAMADPNKNLSNLFAKTGTTTGYASQMDTLIANMLDVGGALTSRTNGINSTIKRMEDQKTALSDRLDKIQKTYLAQFNALDSTIASLNSTSTYLTQQLSAMTSSSKG